MRKTVSVTSRSLVGRSDGLSDSSWPRDAVCICGFTPAVKSVRCEHCGSFGGGAGRSDVR